MTDRKRKTMTSNSDGAEAPRPVVVIGGPTASGKSELACDLAERFDGTVINADSMQLYRELPILSAQPDGAVRNRVPHRLFGVLSGDDPSSAGRWRSMATEAIGKALGAGRLPIVVGGTGLYLSALTDGINEIPPIPDGVREAARRHYDELGGQAFRRRLGERDPDSAARLPAGDRQRLIRAWEVLEATGRAIGSWHGDLAADEDFQFLKVLLLPDRKVLYETCDRRFARMVETGAVDEVRALLDRGYDPGLPIMKAVGVPEIGDFIRGELSLDAAIMAGSQATRRYAKRQYTWFGRRFADAAIFDEQYSESLLPKIDKKIRHFC